MESVQRVVRLLKRRKVADMKTLRDALGGRSRRSVFRDLEAIGYLTSYSHTGRYYTLEDIPQFDELGLWFYRDIGFSRAGTLKQTVAEQVEKTPEGRTHDELQSLLRVRVHNSLLDLVRQRRIGREKFGSVYLYVSVDPERAARQTAERHELRTIFAEVFRVASDEEVVEILVEALSAAPTIPSADEVSRRLRARGFRLEPHHVEQVYEEHRLMAEKKTAQPSSKRPRR